MINICFNQTNVHKLKYSTEYSMAWPNKFLENFNSSTVSQKVTMELFSFK